MLHARGDNALTGEQLKVLEIVGRTASALSALGVVTIITVFCLAPHFRNPMHRLIFINAFYNGFDVTCTMLSISGPAAGNASALCQFQAFLNQMFPLADVLWTLAMAINVFLIVFRGYDTQALKRLEWKYMAVITTATFIPAFAFLFVQTEAKGNLYGSVTMWCSIAPKWVVFRIALYYVPIWTAIFITVIIYFSVGVKIFKRRSAMQSINSNPVLLDEVIVSTSADDTNNSHNDDVTRREWADTRLELESISKSHYREDSLPTSSRGSLATFRHAPHNRQFKIPHHASLSFRQYILMPLFFFLALLTVWVAPSTNRIEAFVNPGFSSYPLLVVVGATGSLRGFWNGVIFITIGMKSRNR